MITVSFGVARAGVSIIRAVFNQSSSPSSLPLWRRIAAFLSFLAVLSALVAPAAVLAEELRTGKLGGLCQVNTASATAGGTADDAALTGSHCDMCGSFALVLPAFTAQTLPTQPDQQVAGIDLQFVLAAAISGLPPSRGPPAL
ncbi:MAG: hypothetical protein ACK44C_00115 [Polaromonas sp.]